LNSQQQRDSQDKMMTADNQLIMQKLNDKLQELLEKLTTMEKRLTSLEKMQLMYRPPKADKHEKIADTLDRLHNDIERLIDREIPMSFIKSKGIRSPEDIG